MSDQISSGRRPTMRLIVRHEGGREETITLRAGPNGEVRIVEGEYLNEIRDAAGMDHFFTKAGYYDGWGGAFSGTEEEAHAVIDAMEEKSGTRGREA